MHTHSTSTSVGWSSAEEIAKLNSLSLLSCSEKLYIQLYPSNPSTQTCQAAMLLQYDRETVRCLPLQQLRAAAGSLFSTCPCSGYVQQQKAIFSNFPCHTFTLRAAVILFCHVGKRLFFVFFLAHCTILLTELYKHRKIRTC